MRILYSPVVSNRKIEYKFGKDKIIVTIDNITDSFDFSNTPNGELKNVETILPISPILNTKREEGKLSVILLNFIEELATEEEKFPKWQEV